MNWQPEIDGRRHTYGLESKYLLDIHEPFSKSKKKPVKKPTSLQIEKKPKIIVVEWIGSQKF